MLRRTFLSVCSTLASSTLLRAAEPARKFKLGFSLYGMRSLAATDGIRACAEIGYACTELAVLKDWTNDVARLTAADVKVIRGASEKHGLPIVALMENLLLASGDETHRRNLERLRLAGQLAHDLSPEHPPVIETILGGAPKDWDATRGTMSARLRDWAKVCEETKTTLAIKAHVNYAAHLPEHLVWLLDEVKSDAVRAAFDYSHFQLRGLKLADCLAALIDRTAFIHVKDAKGEPGKFQFLLPGEGSTDYPAYFKLLEKHGYAGGVVVEVSGQIHSRKDYDPVAAAKQCYDALHAR